MNLDTSQERYSLVSFYGLRVSFPTTHIIIAGVVLIQNEVYRQMIGQLV
jgi:hypothetical protein